MSDTETMEVIWRIRWQIVGTQMAEYKKAKSQGERDEWKQRMLEKLVQMNEIAQKFSPPEIPVNSIPPLEYAALSATGANWCLRLRRELTCLFILARPVGTSRIER